MSISYSSSFRVSFLSCTFPLSLFLSQSDTVDGSAVPLTEPVSECKDEVDLSCNALLWLGKDYSNFIKRDWTQLDQPFQGTQSNADLHNHLFTTQKSFYKNSIVFELQPDLVITSIYEMWKMFFKNVEHGLLAVGCD